MRQMTAAWGQRLLVLFLLALPVLAGGCAVYQDPGPNPAHLVVSAQASVTRQMVEQALVAKARLQYDPLGGAEDVSQPLWDLRAFVPGPDGSYTPLRPLRPVENVEGYDFNGTAEFLAPAGTYKVFFLLECSVRHLSLEGPRPVVEYVYIVTQRRWQTLELCPGCRLELSPFADPTRQP